MATLGFDRAYIGVLDGNEKTTKVFTIDAKAGGTIEAKISGLGANMNTVHASNIPFFISAQGTSSPKLDLDIADIPEECLNAITGATVENGIAKIGANTQPPYVAVILQTKGANGDDIYIGLTKGKFSHPDLDLKTGDDKGTELSTDSISGEFIARSDSYVYAKGRTGQTGFTDSAFKSFIFKGYNEPTKPAGA
ncbi:UNVERIFIED_ORG: phi13 family phage major tail protein [Heyndrickxia coagulans]